MTVVIKAGEARSQSASIITIIMIIRIRIK